MKEEIIEVMSKLQKKAIIYKSQKRLQMAFNDDEYYSYILFEYIRDLQSQLKAKEKAQLKSAREMFEELGYELVETNSAGVKLTMIEYYNFETTSTIDFWTPININIDLQNSEHLTVKHIQAINKQIEELQW